MNTKQKVLATVSVAIILAVAVIIGAETYSNHKIISYASDQCYDRGGSPEVEKDFLGMNYSFSCEGIESAE